MTEQQPHVEVFSRNRVNNSRVTMVVAAIPVTALTGFAIYTVLPFVQYIAYGFLALAVLSALFLIALGVIEIRRRWIAAHVIHLGENGVIDALGWRVLPQPMLLQASQETDEQPGPTSLNDVGILAAVSAGKTQQEAATIYGVSQPYVSRLVRKWKDQHGIE
jgi:hypothetical protein